MGGSCDAEIQGETPEEIMEKGKKHVHEVGDEAHQEIMKQMEGMSEEDTTMWEKDFREKYEAAPEV